MRPYALTAKDAIMPLDNRGTQLGPDIWSAAVSC
jgi:hypothetical protein